MPLIIPSNSQSASGYTIGQSIRFNDDDTAYMSKTFASAGNRKTWTLSFWWKRGNLSGSTNGTNQRQPIFGTTAFSILSNHNSTQIDGINVVFTGAANDVQTSEKFRDVSAWYNFQAVLDTTNDVASERFRLYKNGQRITDFASITYPAKDTEYTINNTQAHYIGFRNSGENLDGYLAEIVFIDGQALDPSSFGEVNDSGIWVPKSVSGLTFGTNGFHIDGRDSSDLGDDESGNGNDFTTSGLAAHDQVLDSPTNNFSVMNVISNYYSGSTFADGNLDVTRGGTTQAGPINNILMSTGKWYCEVYIVGTANSTYIGILGTQIVGSGATPDNLVGRGSKGWSYLNSNGNIYHNGSESSYGASLSAGDILGIAVDLDNSKLYFSKNGTFQNSGVPTSGSTGTGALSITASSSIDLGGYFFSVGDGGNSGTARTVWNYGQEGTFAGNVTAGGNSDGNGIGNFKYSVPSGYLALCTKNLGS